MEPTIKDKEVIVIWKMGKYKVERGDIVIIRSPYDPMRYLCKRVTHLPGESVKEKTFRGVVSIHSFQVIIHILYKWIYF